VAAAGAFFFAAAALRGFFGCLDATAFAFSRRFSALGFLPGFPNVSFTPAAFSAALRMYVDTPTPAFAAALSMPLRISGVSCTDVTPLGFTLAALAFVAFPLLLLRAGFRVVFRAILFLPPGCLASNR
jgi:hypothetical protein